MKLKQMDELALLLPNHKHKGVSYKESTTTPWTLKFSK